MQKDKPSKVLLNDPERDAEKKRLYSSNKPGNVDDTFFYGIARGKNVGVVKGWALAQPQVTGCKKAVCYQAFNTEEEAWKWVSEAKKKLQRKVQKTRPIIKTRPVVGGKKGEEEEYESTEEYISFEDTSEEEQEKGAAPRRAAPPPPPKKIDHTNVNTSWMGSQRYVTDKVWAVEEEEEEVQEEAKLDYDLAGSPVASKYEVGEIIATGASGLVKKGKKKGASSAVVIKIRSSVIVPDFDKEESQNEVQVLKTGVSHENVVTLLDSFVLADALVIVLDLCEGGELFPSLVANTNDYTEKSAASILSQLLSALTFLHKNGVAHLDVVPENILRNKTTGYDIKLAGFSNARKLETACPLPMLIGTPSLQAPEIITKQAVSLSADIWSFGVLAFVLLSGKFPFEDKNVMRLHARIRKADFEFSADWNSISPSAKTLVGGLVQVDATKRLSAAKAAENDFFKGAKANKLNHFHSNFKHTVENTTWIC